MSNYSMIVKCMRMSGVPIETAYNLFSFSILISVLCQFILLQLLRELESVAFCCTWFLFLFTCDVIVPRCDWPWARSSQPACSRPRLISWARACRSSQHICIAFSNPLLHTDVSVRACTSCRPFLITSKSCWILLLSTVSYRKYLF